MRNIENWYKDGDRRTRRAFLLSPCTEYRTEFTEGERNAWKETRWLEWATIEEEFYNGEWLFKQFVEDGL